MEWTRTVFSSEGVRQVMLVLVVMWCRYSCRSAIEVLMATYTEQ